MNKLLLLLTIGLFSISFSQVRKSGAIEIENGLLLYFNSESPYTIELKGEVDLKNYPLINVNGNGFQIIQNTVDAKGKNDKSVLTEYRKWEMNHINEMLPKKVKAQFEFMNHENKVLSFWYYKLPQIENAPKDVTPYKMTLFLDWKKDNMVYRIVHPTFSDDISKSKNLMIQIKNAFNYYSKEIDLKKLYHSIKAGQYFYTE